MRILILEDDLETLSVLLAHLARLEEKDNTDIAVTVMSEYWQVENYLNINPREEFDLILLDRDCKAGGSFHTLSLEKFAGAKIIGISSVPEYNRQLQGRGVKWTVDKDYKDLQNFAVKVSKLIEKTFIRISTNL